MNTNITRKATLTSSITASVEGVKTLGDTNLAVMALENEGIPREAILGLYADNNSTLRFHIECDNSQALAALRDRLVSYLSNVVESEERDGYKATEERDILHQLTTILEGM
jgi:hypothetical protein